MSGQRLRLYNLNSTTADAATIRTANTGSMSFDKLSGRLGYSSQMASGVA